MDCKIEIRNKRGVFDPLASGVKKDIRDLGIDGVKKVSQSQVFYIFFDPCLNIPFHDYDFFILLRTS